MLRKFLSSVAVTGFAVAALAFSATSASPAPPAAGGTKVVNITDPILNMKAYSLTIPSNWVFQGAVIQGTPCIPAPFAVWRMSSPDGLTGFKQEPRLDWAWSENPNAPKQITQGCLDYKKEMPAIDVLKYMVGVLQVEFVNQDPVPWLETAQKNAAAQTTSTSSNHVDIAAAVVRYHINSIQIEDHLRVYVGCLTLRGGMMGVQHYCSAQIGREWSPQGKWNFDNYKPIEHSLVIDQQWNQRWNAEMIQRIKDVYAAGGKMIQRGFDNSNRRMAAQQNAFDQAQDMRQRMHDDFDSTIKRGTDLSMKQAAATSNASHRAADDWADYSLDKQKRLNTQTGEVSKDSSEFSYTWINESGQHYQTNNINDNPNGRLPGTWNLAENVR
jgi:hypothetical protein